MSPADFIAQLEQQQIRLQAENGQLRFFAKPGALTPEIRAQIVARKAELIAYLQQVAAAATTATEQPAIPRADRSQPLPLSFAQERLWFLDQLEGPSATYNVYEACRLRGVVNVPALARALGELVQRHEALRTTFAVAEVTREAMQRIHASLTVPLQHSDLSAHAGSDRMPEALRLANVTAGEPFSLSQGPLIRAHLISLAPDDHIFVFVVHHIVFDGWSIDLVYRELEQLYAAHCQGRLPEAAPAATIQYADYAAWERVHLTGDTLEKSLKFWHEYLAGAPAQLDLPADYTRPPTQTYRGDQTHALIPPPLVQHLRDLGRSEHATLYHVVMTAWKILLLRYTNQPDLVVGTAVANRPQAELESVIGFFVNTVALRTRLEGGLTVRQAVTRVKESTLAALTHNDIPFERLVQSFNPKRSLGLTPIFQICLSFQNQTKAARRFHDLELQPVQLSQKTAKFDLTLWLTDSPEGLRASLEYATDLFSPATAARMLAHFGRILEEMVAQPSASLNTVQMLTEPERRQILSDWNQTTRDYPRDRCLHHLFEEQARLRPEAVALVFGSEALTYAKLNERADQLAAVLRCHGVGPDVLVGLCVVRSFDMVVGILGILKAGGAYVPIDPAYPADRVAFVLEDSHAPVLVTQRPLLATLPKTAAQCVLLDEPLPAPAAAPATPVAVNPSHLAYVLYTSGSTGKPKGVQIPHHAAVNFLNSMRREPGLNAEDVLLAVTTLSFDIAGLELHLPLTTGARIVIAPWEMAADGDALLAALKRHNVTMLQATPATWRLMLAAGWKGTPRLKALCGGEAMPADLAAELIPRCAELWNMYGPTETTIWSTCCRVTDAADIHIGRPIDNTEIYILDALNQPLPVGLPGELLIGGDGLARGYHHRPDLTVDRFVPHPFKPGAKLYRTGDLARYRADGNINCLGRLDHQVKIRGFRIELGEIETQLANHPEIKQNVVVAREDTPGDKRLVAYVVPRPGATPAAAALRDHLRGNLPDYMLPAAFVVMEALPLTPNGKIDRKLLPAPDAIAPAATADAVAPRNPTETRLAAIFAKVLGIPAPSVTASFFDLGGHSLLATKLMAAIEADFGQRLPLAKLFVAPSIEQLAAVLADKSTTQSGWESLVPISADAKGPALFLVHGAGGNILLYRDLARELAPHGRIFGFQSQGLDGQSTPLTNVNQMAQRYTDELLRFQPQGPYYLGGYCMGGIVAFEMARLLRAKGHEVGPIAMLDSYNLNAVQIEQSASARFGALRQNIIFQLDNLRQLSFAEKIGYFREKIRMLIEAIVNSVTHRFRRLKGGAPQTASASPSLASIHDLNHRAGWDHVPGLHAGQLVLFKPQKNYDFFPDPDMGWTSRVNGRVERVELPINPHAMLINPHVKLLAAGIARHVLGASKP